MARVTVEDCLKNVKNRFELVLVASIRARQLMLTGIEPTVPWTNDKATVVALREIAAGNIGPSILDAAPIKLPEKVTIFEIPELKFNNNDNASSMDDAEDELVVIDHSANDDFINDDEDMVDKDEE